MNDLVDTTEMYLRTIYDLEEEGVVPLRARIAERLSEISVRRGQVIVNRHVPNAEIWLAGKAGGFHFRLADDGRWVDTRDGGELFARLAELIQAQAGETIAF